MANMVDCKPCQTPMEINLKLGKDQGDPISDPTLYRRLVGSLIYLSSTRPDLAYAVQVGCSSLVRETLRSPLMPMQTMPVALILVALRLGGV
ncbi:Retrovirus-related Pol polyprotein from transposon RE2 [Linum perenne]